MTAALLVLLATYGAIGAGGLPGLKLDRPAAALLGGLAMMILKVVTPASAWRAVDLPTLGLLLGLMLLAAGLARTGLFASLAERVVERFSSPRALLAAVIVSSGVLSALLLNDAVCLLFTPLVLEVTRRAGLKPLPFLLGVATASNTGGACTISGNPQNALIGLASGIGFGEFFLRLVPASALALLLCWAVIAWAYRGELTVRATAATVPAAVPLDRGRLAVCGLAAAGMVAAFLAGADLAMAALAAGAVALLATHQPGAAFQGVDFPLLLLFAGLFVVTEGVRESGLAERLFTLLAPALTGGHLSQLAGVSALALILSNLVSNVPAVMLLSHPLSTLGSKSAWLALAISSSFAGNLTLMGSIANLIVAEVSRRDCPISFAQYLRVGVPITLATLGVGIVVLAGLGPMKG